MKWKNIIYFFLGSFDKISNRNLGITWLLNRIFLILIA